MADSVNENTVKQLSKGEMHNYLCCVNYQYLLGMSSRERVDLCKYLVEQIKNFPEYECPELWQDVIRNPGIYNERANRELGGIPNE